MPLPTWDNLPLPGRYTSRLPEAYPGAPVGPLGIPVEWAQRSIEAATLAAGHFMQDLAVAHGWPGDLDALDDLISTAKLIANAAEDADPLAILQSVEQLLRNSDLLRAALAAPLERVQAEIADAVAGAVGGLVSAAEIVPIVGWVVAIARFVVTAVRLRTSDTKFGVTDLIEGFNWAEAPHFERDRDDDETNRMLAVLKTGDWTSIWLPSTAPWDKRALTFTGAKRLEGWMFGPGVGGLEHEGFSCMPGIAQIGARFYGPIDWYAKHSASDLVPVHSTSDVYPSVNVLAGLAWTRLQVPSGQCCAVDYGAVRQAWNVWQGEGRKWLETASMREPAGNVELAAKIAALRTMVEGALGWGFDDNGRPLRTGLYPGSRLRRGSTAYVRDRVGDALDAMKKRTFRLLGTPAVAYVPPSAPALRDVELRVRYAAMRVALLEHEARYDVELDLVPDAPYRQMLFQSMAGGTFKSPGGIDRRRTLDGSPAPDSPRLPDVPTGNGTAEGGGGMVAVLAAALVLAALWRAR